MHTHDIRRNIDRWSSDRMTEHTCILLPFIRIFMYLRSRELEHFRAPTYIRVRT